jgi:hypothetical protein
MIGLACASWLVDFIEKPTARPKGNDDKGEYKQANHLGLPETHAQRATMKTQASVQRKRRELLGAIVDHEVHIINFNAKV